MSFLTHSPPLFRPFIRCLHADLKKKYETKEQTDTREDLSERVSGGISQLDGHSCGGSVQAKKADKTGEKEETCRQGRRKENLSENENKANKKADHTRACKSAMRAWDELVCMKTKVRSCQVKQKQRLRGCSGKNAKRRGERKVEKWRHRIAESAKAAKRKAKRTHVCVGG